MRMELAPGMTYRQLDHWTNRGWLRPQNGARPGAGRHRCWDEHELAVAAMIARLREAGVELPTAARAARILLERQSPAELAPGVVLVVQFPMVPA